MNKLYVGSLPPDAGESSLRQLFAEFGIACGSITIKRPGYAFVDFPDQSSADKAIDKLNGKSRNFSKSTDCPWSFSYVLFSIPLIGFWSVIS